jgi:hypothetical protein
MVDTSPEEVTYDQIGELARWLFQLSDPGDWSAIDECERTHWRKTAQRKLQEERRYKKSAEKA